MKSSQQKNRWSIELGSSFVVVSYDPEFADLDNPQGAVVRERYHLEATNDHGDRRVWGCFVTVADAEAAIADAPPVYTWAESYPVYASDAYMEYGEEEMRHWEARHQEWEGWFPGDRWARF